MKSWLKGGLWGLGIGAVLSVIFSVLMEISYILGMPLYFLTGVVGFSQAMLGIIELPFEGLIEGIVMGAIIGKIKSKNKSA